MGARGPKSTASLEVVSSGISAIHRPEPVSGLTTDQANEWIDIVNRLPAEWFPRETHGMLAQYCRHIVSSRRVGELIESLVGGEMASENFVGDYDKLLKMQEREGRAMSSLATRMRISQQAQYSKDKGKGGPRQKPPHLQ